MPCFTFPMPKKATFLVRPSLKWCSHTDGTDSETFAQCTHTRSATTETLKNAGAIATVGIRMIMDRPWAQKVKADWEANMVSLDGHKVRAKIEQVFESYPLNKDVDRMVCACH